MLLFLYNCSAEDAKAVERPALSIATKGDPAVETHSRSSTNEPERLVPLTAHYYLPHSGQHVPSALMISFRAVTTIRELPCLHFLHPKCIDSFLSNNSSLCPMCEKSTLPLGYCPVKITNTMVTREHAIRRMRGSNVLPLRMD